MAINLQTGGTVREWLNSETGQIQAAGTVREFLIYTPTAFQTSRLVRETLANVPHQVLFGMAARESLIIHLVSLTQFWVGMEAREALIPRTVVTQSMLAREILFLPRPTFAWMGNIVREAMNFHTARLEVSKIAREIMYFLGPVNVSYEAREALLIVQNVLTLGLVARETFFVPFTVEQMGLVARETLLEGFTQLWFSKIARETIYFYSTLVRAQMTYLGREALIPSTLVVMTLEARETLIPGIAYMHMTKVARETLFQDPSFVPPAKHRKAYVWINYGRT